MPSIFDNHREKVQEIAALQITTKDRILTGITSFVLALLIVIGPITVLINCFIFVDAIVAIICGLCLCLFLLIFLSRTFYIKGIVQKQVTNLRDFYIVEALIIAIIVLALAFLFIF